MNIETKHFVFQSLCVFEISGCVVNSRYKFKHVKYLRSEYVKYPRGEITHVTKYSRGENFQSATFPRVENSRRRNIRIAKCPWGKNSALRIFHAAKLSEPKLSAVNFPAMKLPVTIIYICSLMKYFIHNTYYTLLSFNFSIHVHSLKSGYFAYVPFMLIGRVRTQEAQCLFFSTCDEKTFYFC